MKQHMMAVVLIVAVASAGGGFFAGTKYQQSKRGQFFMQGGSPTQGRMGSPMGNGTGMRGGFRPVTGEVLKTDGTSMTVKLSDGSSKIILLTEKTEINTATKGTANDLVTGTKVAVFGSENTDGSVTAQNVQINPLLQRNQESTPSAK
jgi:hypothetical protein